MENVSAKQKDTELLIDLYRQAKQVRDYFINDDEPAYREMAKDVHTAAGNMLEGMGVGFWNGENEMAFYKDAYR